MVKGEEDGLARCESVTKQKLGCLTQLLLPPASWPTVVRCLVALHSAAMRRLLLLGWPPAITAAVPPYLGAARGWFCSVPAAAATTMGLVVVTGPFFGWLWALAALGLILRWVNAKDVAAAG